MGGEGKKRQVRNQSSASEKWPQWQYIPTPGVAPTPDVMHLTSDIQQQEVKAKDC